MKGVGVKSFQTSKEMSSCIFWAFITEVALLEILITKLESVEAIVWRCCLKYVFWRFSQNLQRKACYVAGKSAALLEKTALQVLFCELSKNFWSICFVEHD